MSKSHDGDDVGDPFAMRDLWAPSIFTANLKTDAEPGLDPFGIPDHLLSAFNDAPKQNAPDLYLPDLETFKFGALDDISAPESVATTDVDAHQLLGDNLKAKDDDIWLLAQDPFPVDPKNAPSWERFHNEDYREPNAFLSEAGPLAFSAALRRGRHKAEESHIGITLVKTEHIMKSLFLLSIGVESLFFVYDGSKQTYKSRFEKVTVPGVSTQLMSGLVSKFVGLANNLRFLDTFVERSYQTSKSSSTRIALADCIKSIVKTLRSSLAEAYPSSRSLLQLRHGLRRPASIIEYISDLIRQTRNSDTTEQILTKLFDLAQTCEFGDTWIQPLMLEVLARTSRPWLESIAVSVGLTFTDSVDMIDRQRLLDNATKVLEGDPDSDASNIIPAFMGAEEQEKILSAATGLELLKSHHEDHVLAKSGRNQFTRGPSLEWHFGWTDIERVQRKAKDYEESIQAAMQARLSYVTHTFEENKPAIDPWSPYGKSEELIKHQFTQTSSMMDDPASAESRHDAVLEQTVKDTIAGRATALRPERTIATETSFSPPIALCPSLSFSPLLTTQARLINHASLRMLFRKHHLSSHLALQHSFQLLGSGLFSTRLSNSLFSPNLNSAERRKGHARSGALGLRLSARDTWPPASSELQLALAGVLVDSYQDDTSISRPPASRQESLSASADLPGGLSFAIRSLNEEEIKACLDQHSLYALDFLRLQYKPPAPLDVVISENSLDKYDRIFKLLLRVQRLLFITGQMSRQFVSRQSHGRAMGAETRFRIESTHFVNTLADYFFHVAIGTTWLKFWSMLRDLEGRLEAQDGLDRLAEGESIHKLREMHDKVLDSILFGLLLRNRQMKVMALLEKIFGCVLRFVRIVDTGVDDQQENLRELYDQFKKDVQVFVTVCRGLSNRTGYGSGTGRHAEDNTIEQLVLRLDMNGWYSKS